MGRIERIRTMKLVFLICHKGKGFPNLTQFEASKNTKKTRDLARFRKG